MMQRRAVSCKSIRYRVWLGLAVLASAAAAWAQVIPLPLNTTVFVSPVNVSQTAGLSYGQQVAMSPGGGINVVWLDNTPGYYAVFFSHSVDDGLTFSTPQNLSSDPGGSWAPQIAVDSGGNINVVWAAMTGNQNLFLSRSTDGGATFSEPASIANNLTYSPRIILDAGGIIYLGWVDASMPSRNVFFSRSDDGGATFTAPAQVSNRPPAGSTGIPLIAVDSNGNISFVWQDCLSYCSIWFNYSTDGGVRFSPQRKIGGPLEFASPLGLAMDSSGNIYVVFNTVPFGNVWLSMITSGGATLSGVNVSNVPFRHSAGEAQIAIDSNNNINIVWKDQNPGILYLSRSTDGGATFAATTISASGDGPQVAADNNNNIDVVWTGGSSAYDILFSRSTDGGASFSSPQNLSNHGSSGTSLSQPSPLMVLDGCGDMNVTWIDNQPGNFDIFFSRGTTTASILDGCILSLPGAPFRERRSKQTLKDHKR